MTDIDVFGAGVLDEGDRQQLVRSHLTNLITSYADEADVFTELIQNAVDAVYRMPPGESPLITVAIGRRSSGSHYLYVQDNGTGMAPETAERLCIPGYSTHKVRGQTIGYKGVGASYVAAVSEHFALWTEDADGQVTERTIRYAFSWVTNPEKPLPEVTDSFVAPEVVQALRQGAGRGTGVYYEFHSGHRPVSLDNTVIVGDGIEQELLNWASYLAARTPIGRADKPTAPAGGPDFIVKLLLDHGVAGTLVREFIRSAFNRDQGTLGYPFPESVFRVGIDTAEIDAEPAARKHERHYRKHQAVFHTWNAAELLDIIDLDDEELALLSSHLLWVRGHLSYSTDVLKKVNQLLGGRSSLVRYGAKLAVDGVPQGRPLDLSLTSDQGLDRQTHIVLGFSELELDIGRKFISDEKILSAVAKINQRVVSLLKDYRIYLKKKDLEPISSDLEAWGREIDQRRNNSLIPVLLRQTDAGSALSVDPASENDVITLWGGLVASKRILGFEMLALSGFNRYDALVDITAEAIEPAHDDKLAVIATSYVPKLKSVLEFKWDFVDLITDFEDNAKNPQEIDFVVCWDCSDLNLRRGSLKPTYGMTWRHERPVRGVSYVWTDDDGSSAIYVLALRNLAAEILAMDDVDEGSALLAMIEARDKAKMV
jgi:hypothetical protein